MMLPCKNAQFIPRVNPALDNLVDQREALIFAIRALQKTACGRVDPEEMVRHSKNTLKGIRFLLPGLRLE